MEGAAEEWFYLSQEALQRGDLDRLRELAAVPDPARRAMVLNGLWDNPGPDPHIRGLLVEIALAALDDPEAPVRCEACRLIQNQCAWGVDVSPCCEKLLHRLHDESEEVRNCAAWAVGHLARRRCGQLEGAVASLTALLSAETLWVVDAAAWALGQLSRGNIDIGEAVPHLAAALDRLRHEYPRTHLLGVLNHYGSRSAERAARVMDLLSSANLTADEGTELARLWHRLEGMGIGHKLR